MADPVDEWEAPLPADEPRADIFKDEIGELAKSGGLTKAQYIAAREEQLRRWPLEDIETR